MWVRVEPLGLRHARDGREGPDLTVAREKLTARTRDWKSFFRILKAKELYNMVLAAPGAVPFGRIAAFCPTTTATPLAPPPLGF
jgi:hypothetical protein